jgi:hypothetical protein
MFTKFWKEFLPEVGNKNTYVVPKIVWAMSGSFLPRGLDGAATLISLTRTSMD